MRSPTPTWTQLTLAFLIGTGVATASASGPSPPLSQDAALGDAQPSEQEAPTLAARCGECHPSQSDTWDETPMARALEALQPAELQGLAAVADPATGLNYHFEEARGSARIVESWSEVPTGKRPHRDSARLRFAIGAGVLDRSYAALQHGRLWFAPLEVVRAADSSRHAAMAPPHTITPGSRLRIPITAECLGCHTDTPPPRTWPLNLDPTASGWTPSGVSCAACHGRALEHASWREADLSDGDPEGPDPIVALSQLAAHERLSVCAACHLQGDARIELQTAATAPPPPGSDLLRQRAVFVAREPTEEIGFVSHVERLLLSRCFLESLPAEASAAPPVRDGKRDPAAGALLCATCHDPHRALSDPSVRARTRAACLTCHPAMGPASIAPDSSRSRAAPCARADPAPTEAQRASDCVTCHMPRRPVFDVAEVEIHDHFIRVVPEASGASEEHVPRSTAPLRFAEAPAGPWKRVRWPGVDPPAHIDDPGLWMMACFHGGQFEQALSYVDRPPGAEVARLAMYHHVRGVLLERAERAREAEASYERALELDPALAEARSNLGLLLGRTGRIDEGLLQLDRLLESYPKADGALRNRALLHRAAGRTERFLEDLERSMQLLPDAGVARALAETYAAAGRADLAQRWSAEARRLDPLSE